MINAAVCPKLNKNPPYFISFNSKKNFCQKYRISQFFLDLVISNKKFPTVKEGNSAAGKFNFVGTTQLFSDF